VTARAKTPVVGRLSRHLTLALLVTGLTPAGFTRYVGVDNGLGPQAYYRTGFPVSDVSGALERVAASVVQILVQRRYETYLFTEDDAPTAVQFQNTVRDVLALAVDTVLSNETIASTGVVIASMPRKLTILTADHALHFPDTIVDYFDADGGDSGLEPDERAIERISIKTEQVNTVSSERYVDPFEILARDPPEDLALISVTFATNVVSIDRPPSRLAAGDPRQVVVGIPRVRRRLSRRPPNGDSWHRERPRPERLVLDRRPLERRHERRSDPGRSGRGRRAGMGRYRAGRIGSH
jgi:hypothetical protein